MGRDVTVGAALLVLAGLYWLGADQIRVSILEGGVGAQGVPKALAVTLAVLTMLMIAQSAWQRYRAPAPQRAGGADAEATRKHLRALGMLAIGTGYLLLVSVIGYVLAVALLMLTTAAYIGRPLSLRLAGIAAAGAALYYVLFVIFLGIPLPAGIWPGLWRELSG